MPEDNKIFNIAVPKIRNNDERNVKKEGNVNNTVNDLLDRRIEDLEEKIGEIQKSLKENNEKEGKIKQLEEEIKQFRELNAELEKKITELEKTNRNLKINKINLEEEIAELEKTIKNQKIEIEEKREALFNALANNSELKEYNGRLLKAQNDIKKLLII